MRTLLVCLVTQQGGTFLQEIPEDALGRLPEQVDFEFPREVLEWGKYRLPHRVHGLKGLKYIRYSGAFDHAARPVYVSPYLGRKAP